MHVFNAKTKQKVYKTARTTATKNNAAKRIKIVYMNPAVSGYVIELIDEQKSHKFKA